MSEVAAAIRDEQEQIKRRRLPEPVVVGLAESRMAYSMFDEPQMSYTINYDYREPSKVLELYLGVPLGGSLGEGDEL